MKVLVTGFDPFGEEKINPSYRAVELLPDVIAGAKIEKLEIPTSFSGSVRQMEAAIRRHQPDIVIQTGQAGGRSCITIEQAALNLVRASIPDNDGCEPANGPLAPEGVPAYYATVPVEFMTEAVRKHGIPCYISDSAGTYVCNSVFYHVLGLAKDQYPHMHVGFIHFPYCAEQAVNKPNGPPFMSVEMMAKALEYAIEGAIMVLFG